MKPYIETKRILLIEDHGPLRAVMHDYLSRAGYAVTSASFGEEGLRHVLENPCETFDLVISDYRLGGDLSGGEVANAIQQKCPDTPVLFISGHPPPSHLRGEAFLLKPAMPEQVLAEVARLLRSRADTIPPEAT